MLKQEQDKAILKESIANNIRELDLLRAEIATDPDKVSAEDKRKVEIADNGYNRCILPQQKQVGQKGTSVLLNKDGKIITTTTEITVGNAYGTNEQTPVPGLYNIIKTEEMNAPNNVYGINYSAEGLTTQKAGECQPVTMRTDRKGGNPSTYNPSPNSIYNPVTNR